MKWRTAALVLACSAGVSHQEPDREALYKELRGKLDASWPVSANLTFETVDAKGSKTVGHKSKLYLRLSEGWVYLETQEVGKEGPPACLALDGNRYVMAWPKGGGGQRMDVQNMFKALWKHQWHFDREGRKVLEDPDPPKDFDGYVASRRFRLNLQLELTKDEASFKFALGTSDKGGASWLGSVRGTAKLAATPETVTVTETPIPRTTVIDRRTGFLRSIRLELSSGESKLVSVSDVVVKAAPPDIAIPEQWKDRQGRIADTLKFIAPMLRMEAASAMADLLNRWSEAGRQDRAGALRDYIAWIGAEFDALNRQAARVTWAAEFVKKRAESGSLDEVRRDIEAQAKLFDDQARKTEADRRQEEAFTVSLAGFRKELEKAVAEAMGTEVAKGLLVRRLQEGFEPDRIRKAVPSLRRPDDVTLLREAIDDAREQGGLK